MFDAFKEQVWPINDPSFSGYSSLNLFLKNLGYRTKENHKPYEKALAHKGSETLFVIGVAMEARFTEEEIMHVCNFVSRGGKVLIIAEHDNQYGCADFLWPLITAAGWGIDKGHISAHEIALPNTNGAWIKTVTPENKEGPVFLCAAELTPLDGKENKVLLKAGVGREIVAGLSAYGKGRFAVVTDSEFLWNGDPDYKWDGTDQFVFHDPKSKEFIKYLFSEIHPVERKEQVDDFNYANPQQNAIKVYLYGNGGDFYFYSNFIKALNEEGLPVYKYRESLNINPDDRVIVITPLQKMPAQVVNELSKSKKIVIFADMYSSIESYADSWTLFFQPHNMKPLPYPANTLAEKYGVRFLPCYGVNLENNKYGNIFYFPVFFKEKKIYLHRACSVELLEGKKNRDIVFKNSKGTFACRAGFGLNHSITGMNPNDIKDPEFLIATDKILAVGDSDLISDDFFQQARVSGFFALIVDFLKP